MAVATAAGADVALDVLRHAPGDQRPDLVIVDCMLPAAATAAEAARHAGRFARPLPLRAGPARRCSGRDSGWTTDVESA